MAEIRTQEIDDYKVWPATVFPHSVVESINHSHKEIVRAAKELGLPEVCIAEDDLMFTAAGAWRYFLEQKPPPEEYDLYLGGTYIRPYDPLHVCGFHLYFVSAKFYDRYLSVPAADHIDTAMDSISGEKQYKLCYPMVALQRAGFSQNNMAEVNYNIVIDKKDLYT